MCTSSFLRYGLPQITLLAEFSVQRVRFERQWPRCCILRKTTPIAQIEFQLIVRHVYKLLQGTIFDSMIHSVVVEFETIRTKIQLVNTCFVSFCCLVLSCRDGRIGFANAFECCVRYIRVPAIVVHFLLSPCVYIVYLIVCLFACWLFGVLGCLSMFLFACLFACLSVYYFGRLNVRLFSCVFVYVCGRLFGCVLVEPSFMRSLVCVVG